jgi:ribosomal protein L29
MKKSTYIFKWWRKQEEINLTKNLISIKKAQVINTNKEIEELNNKLEKLKKEIFEVRLDAIEKADPVEEYIKGE